MCFANDATPFQNRKNGFLAVGASSPTISDIPTSLSDFDPAKHNSPIPPNSIIISGTRILQGHFGRKCTPILYTHFEFRSLI